MASSPATIAITIYRIMKILFKNDKVTGAASVELWVVMTTLMLVFWFVLVSIGARTYSNKFMISSVQVLDLLNYNLVHYTMGQMQLSAVKVNDYFQVWAVMLVTLQYSVKVGRRYNRSKQIPLLDIMSSFWSANLLRVQTTYLLKMPLWLIWTANSARIVFFFFTSEKAEEGHKENSSLVTDYMCYEHTLSSNADAVTMSGYNYLVHGEDLRAREILLQERMNGSGKHTLQLDPGHCELITVEKIWNVDNGNSGLLGRDADSGNKLKDICLSFALYKLLKRRFHGLTIHEARQPVALEKKRRLVLGYILEDAENYERALRITEVELSFMRDSFYSRYAATFAARFSWFLRVSLSLILIMATGYIAYPVRDISQRIDQADKNLITHGVSVTRFMVGLIILKELWEIYLFAFSQWSKVLMICKYVKHQCWRRPLVEKVMRVFFFFITTGKWNHLIGQYNLLILSTRRFTPRTKKTTKIKLKAEVKKAIFDSFKGLDDQQRLESYLSSAFGSNERLCRKLAWAGDELENHSGKTKLEADTHRILVWHIATCLCEINLSGEDAAKATMVVSSLNSRPYINETKVPTNAWKHYITAVSLSNYCAYLLTKLLVPDNGLVVERVLTEVRRETRRATTSTPRSKTLQDIYDKLMKVVTGSMEVMDEAPKEQHQDNQATEILLEEQLAQGGVQTDDLEEGTTNDAFRVVNETHTGEDRGKGPNGDGDGFENTIIKMGSELGIELIDAYKDNGPLDLVGLWRDLGKFWAGFLLHLAASTRAAKHKRHLTSNTELITHLWALLSHASYHENIRDNEEILDPIEQAIIDPLS